MALIATLGTPTKRGVELTSQSPGSFGSFANPISLSDSDSIIVPVTISDADTPADPNIAVRELNISAINFSGPSAFATSTAYSVGSIFTDSGEVYEVTTAITSANTDDVATLVSGGSVVNRAGFSSIESVEFSTLFQSDNNFRISLSIAEGFGARFDLSISGWTYNANAVSFSSPETLQTNSPQTYTIVGEALAVDWTLPTGIQGDTFDFSFEFLKGVTGVEDRNVVLLGAPSGTTHTVSVGGMPGDLKLYNVSVVCPPGTNAEITPAIDKTGLQY